MGEELTGTTFLDRRADRAWRELRRQLADHLAGMGVDQVVELEVEVGLEHEEVDGEDPSVDLFRCGGPDRLRAEAPADSILDSRWPVGSSGAALLRQDGWLAPGHEAADGSHWVLERETARVDEVAHLAVRALRHVYGCAHPAFLRVYGDFVPTGIAAPAPADAAAADRAESAGGDEEAADTIVHPRGHEELVSLVTEALAEQCGQPVEPDSDGDFPIRFGQSVLFVRVWESERAIEVYAELVAGVEDADAARREANAFNRDVVVGTCWVHGGIIRFRHVLCAMPFSSAQLQQVLGRIASDLDERAEDMAERVGGRRFLDDLPAPPADEEPATIDPFAEGDRGRGEAEVPPPPAHPMLPVLGELLEVEEPSDRVVAGLFDGDVQEIAGLIETLREDPPADLDVADAIALLRLGLVYAARRRADRTVGGRSAQRRRPPASQQSALISPREVDGSGLDLGLDG